jgi:hypothetical protein
MSKRLDVNGHVPPGQQTRIASFLMSAHGAHARQLAATVPARLRDGWQAELHAQFCSEIEFVSLLARSTSWTPDPMLPFLAAGWELAWLPRPAAGAAEPLQGLLIDTAAFGHALHAAIRPAALLSEQAAPLDPFVHALRRMELESGRLMQGQILFLKSPALARMRDVVTRAVEWRHAQLRGEWTKMLRGIGVPFG